MTQASQIFKGKIIGVVQEGRIKNGARYLKFLTDDKTVVVLVGTDVGYFLTSDCVGLRFEAGGKKTKQGYFSAAWMVVWGRDPFPSYLRMKKYGSIQEYNRRYRMEQKKNRIMSATAKRTMTELALDRANLARREKEDRESRTRAFFDNLIEGCRRKQSPMVNAAIEAAQAFEDVIRERNEIQKTLDQLSNQFINGE